MQSKPAATCSGHYKELVSKMLYDESLFADFSMYTFCSQSGGHDDRVECEQKGPDRLTLQDLQTLDVPPSQPGCVCQERPPSGTVERRAVAGSFNPPSSNSRVRDKIVCVFLSETFKRQTFIFCASSCLMLHTVIYACAVSCKFNIDNLYSRSSVINRACG